MTEVNQQERSKMQGVLNMILSGLDEEVKPKIVYYEPPQYKLAFSSIDLDAMMIDDVQAYVGNYKEHADALMSTLIKEQDKRIMQDFEKGSITPNEVREVSYPAGQKVQTFAQIFGKEEAKNYLAKGLLPKDGFVISDIIYNFDGRWGTITRVQGYPFFNKD